MRDFKRNRGGSNDSVNFLGLVCGVLLLLLIAGFAVRAAWDMYTKFAVASEGSAASGRELTELEGQYAHMSAAVADISSPRGAEGKIRERFGVAKPGEGEIRIVRSSTSTDGIQDRDGGNIFLKIFHALFVW